MKFFWLTIFSFLLAQSNCWAFVILLDPGHGGEELGAVAKIWPHENSKKMANIYEKDLTLTLAKLLKKYLEKQHTVYLTRSFDRTVNLDERAQMADTVKADLFISLHFNSATDSYSNGFETYYLNNHNDAAVKKIESKENMSVSGEEKIVNQILIDLIAEKTSGQSKKLSELIHSEVAGNTAKKYKLKNRGVRPGLFYVLALSKRPNTLLEVGFLSNPQEVKKIKNQIFLDSYAKNVARGINRYLESQR